ncbi:SubName: Full=Uncharacterized protein {ECO:0000313/EMBL:CCA74775.1}, partial [Serendipita indica DSM 11827]
MGAPREDLFNISNAALQPKSLRTSHLEMESMSSALDDIVPPTYECPLLSPTHSASSLDSEEEYFVMTSSGQLISMEEHERLYRLEQDMSCMNLKECCKVFPSMDIFQPDDSLPDVELEWIEDDYSSGQKTLFHLLKEVIKRASALTSQQVAQRIDDLYPPNRSPEDQANEDANDTPGGYLWSIWEEFHWFATRIPYNHPAQDRLAS